jgi:heme exporter protein A
MRRISRFSATSLTAQPPRGQAAARLMQLTGDNLACQRGERTVFSGLSFSLSGGEALLVTGRNGAGKSSLLRLIAGLLRKSAGQLELSGAEADATLGEQSHYLGHQDAVKPALSVGENLQFWADYLGSGPHDIAAALEAVDLSALAGLPAGYLSAGQRRRLSIARLVAVPRPVWLLDEPTSALDEPSQKRLAELMRGHLASGGMIVAAAHGPIGLERARELKLGPQ